MIYSEDFEKELINEKIDWVSYRSTCIISSVW